MRSWLVIPFLHLGKPLIEITHLFSDEIQNTRQLVGKLVKWNPRPLWKRLQPGHTLGHLMIKAIHSSRQLVNPMRQSNHVRWQFGLDCLDEQRQLSLTVLGFVATILSLSLQRFVSVVSLDSTKPEKPPPECLLQCYNTFSRCLCLSNNPFGLRLSLWRKLRRLKFNVCYSLISRHHLSCGLS